MSNIIARESQKLSHDAIITLYEIDLIEKGQGVIRFQSDSNASLFRNGYEYFPYPIEADGFEISGGGTLPTPTLRASIIDLTFNALLISLDDLENCDVTRIQTFRKFLDDGSDPQPNISLNEPDLFYISRMSEKTNSTVTFELSSKLDVLAKRIPARQIIKSTCMQTYRTYNSATNSFSYTNVTCPYSRNIFFDRNGNSTSIDKDACSKDLKGCKLRFGNGELPFSGFPGASRF